VQGLPYQALLYLYYSQLVDQALAGFYGRRPVLVQPALTLDGLNAYDHADQ
jgi:hypothetical protein